ncbi:putative 2-hydroxyacid dehydrogenase [Caenibius tardaugens NBRC 16725]|uniref:Putative 2-hydroxyacid dehydrogenase n=2 Tax=Caenibius TaxID=2827482 RepID=U2Y5A2_9SPHN|nr:2-hydroxyacid dehydrogenase [Caenibius tardaugens NBRC 16725]GAD48301.1 putative 2-hydroxyacid dehydrogenase [Caenibius tardaugens NBRC 16725]
MIRPDILVAAPMPLAVMAALDARFTAHRLWELGGADALPPTTRDAIVGIAANTLAGQIDSRLFDRLPHLQIVANFGVGYDNVDARAAAERGVIVTNTPGVLDAEVADLTVGLLLATIRRIPQADRYVREGRWATQPFPLSATLQGRQIGILGLGAIGKAIARRLAAFDLAIAYCGRHRQPDVPYAYFPDARSLAQACDVLIVIVPGGDATTHLVDRPVLTALGPQGVLINVSRGSVVDEEALIAALQDGTIAAAGLDVYVNEPHVPAALIAMANVVLLPHVGSGSVATRAAMGQLVVDNLIAWFTQGKPLTPVAESRHLPGAV